MSLQQVEDDAQLGRFEQSFASQTRVAVITATWGLALGVPLGALGIALLAHSLTDPHGTGGVGAGGALTALCLLLVPFSIRRLAQAMRLRGTSFLVYEKGFICRTKRSDVVVPWAEVMTFHSSGSLRAGRLQQALAVDFRFKVRCAGGLNYRMNTMTGNARGFHRAVSARAEQQRATGEELESTASR